MTKLYIIIIIFDWTLGSSCVARKSIFANQTGLINGTESNVSIPSDVCRNFTSKYLSFFDFFLLTYCESVRKKLPTVKLHHVIIVWSVDSFYEVSCIRWENSTCGCHLELLWNCQLICYNLVHCTSSYVWIMIPKWIFLLNFTVPHLNLTRYVGYFASKWG